MGIPTLFLLFEGQYYYQLWVNTFLSFLQLLRDSKVSKICNVTEAVIEALLEQQAYSEVQVSQ